MKKIIDELWESQRNEESKAYIDKLLKCDVLIIDEAFSKDKIHLWQSGNQIGYIDEFLRERLNNRKVIYEKMNYQNYKERNKKQENNNNNPYAYINKYFK
jgi:hypothetical protein